MLLRASLFRVLSRSAFRVDCFFNSSAGPFLHRQCKIGSGNHYCACAVLALGPHCVPSVSVHAHLTFGHAFKLESNSGQHEFGKLRMFMMCDFRFACKRRPCRQRVFQVWIWKRDKPPRGRCYTRLQHLRLERVRTQILHFLHQRFHRGHLVAFIGFFFKWGNAGSQPRSVFVVVSDRQLRAMLL